MEVGVRVETEDLMAGTVTHLASAYLTFVALDENRRPVTVPPLDLVTEDDHRRNREAAARRTLRLAEKQKELACQEDESKC
jgi:acyl-CoA hydrolase